ncbi:carboxylesterase family protein [Xylariaceae sp. FL1019]|nr:carboxylesterase family protein [Xylariaceae sp. FL1019]
MTLAKLLVFLPMLTRAVDLPVVDLGYERHQAISYNETGGYYNFTNIRYGQAPIGDLRWAKPVAPAESSNNDPKVVNGSEQGGNCPAVFPCWFTIQTGFTEAYLAGEEFDFNASYEELYADNACSTAPTQAALAGQSEDCLFLDVFAPQNTFDNAADGGNPTAAVLVYIYGGGYSGGAKNFFGYFDGSPAGLIDSSRVTNPDGLIYIGINYRLGGLGWMVGSDFTSQGGIQNLGLYDQRLALEWVQDNVHLFGGDPNRVTVMGESAGGGSILMQMTAFGTGEKAPFQQAIMQSPAWEPDTAGSPDIQNQIFNEYLALMNVASLEEAKHLPSSKVIDANYIWLRGAKYGSTFLGPTIGGDFVPDDPKRLLRDGKVDSSVKLLTTIAANEGLRFAPGNVSTEADFVQWVDFMLGGASTTVRDQVINEIYPSIFDGSFPWTNQLERAGVFWAELVSTCNARYLQDATNTTGYANLFNVWPSLHQGDIPYVFFNGPLTTSSVNETVARISQDYITAFAIKGEPNNPESPSMLPYDKRLILSMTANGFSLAADPTDNTRCAYWLDAPYA